MAQFAVQRANMVESQIRTNDVTDRRIQRAMATISREIFVPSEMRAMAYMDAEIPLSGNASSGLERMLVRPMVLAKLLQLADIADNDLVLDIGCTTGYSTAVLCHLCESVVGLDSDEAFIEKAARNLAEVNLDNAAVIAGPMPEGRPGDGPFDVIFISGKVQEVPDKLRTQLKPGGRLVAIVDDGGMGRAKIFERVGDGWSGRTAFNAAGPLLPGFEKEPAFHF